MGKQRRRLPALARAGIKSNLFFARTRAGQKTLLTPRVPASLARFGVHPPILGAQRSGSQNSCLSQPAQLGGGPLRALVYGPQARQKKRGPPQGPPNQSRESRGENLSPLALFPPVSREKRGPPPGRRPTGRCAPRLRKSPDHPKGTPYRPPPPRRGLFLPNSLDKGSLIG